MDVFFPLQWVADKVAYDILSLTSTSPFGVAVHFFLYDTLKILLLLLTVTFVMSVLNRLFPIEKVRTYIATHKLYGFEYLLASLFGTVTPFCSCSSVPLFIGFIKGGIPLGVTLTFLISSPLVDSVVVAMLIGLFGLKITLLYVVTGIVLSVVSGYALGKMKLEKYLTDWVQEMRVSPQSYSIPTSQESLFTAALSDAYGICKKILPYVVLGVAVGAGIHGYVPEQFFETFLGSHSAWSVPLAVLMGVPLYASAAGIVPIAQALVVKGVPLGVVLAFMMATVGLSLPEGLLLKKVMKWQLLTVFFGVVTSAIVFSGIFFVVVL